MKSGMPPARSLVAARTCPACWTRCSGPSTNACWEEAGLYAPMHPVVTADWRVAALLYRFADISAKTAPCGSEHCKIQVPPGTSVGPIRILPPLAFTRSPAASTVSTLK